MLATLIALRGGPDGAAEMMRRTPQTPMGLGNIEASDAFLSKDSTGPLAAMVAYNAARVRDIAAPAEAKADYWRDVSRRYRQASSLLTDAKKKTLADEQAKAADEVAATLK